MPYPSAVLFHGPTAHARALVAARGLGRLLRDVGEGGLKIADSREIIDLMNGAPVGDEPGVIVMGPMDLAQQGATDVLLKSLEEFNPSLVRPVLWANDETEVISTIRSRCLRRWCPGVTVTDESRLVAARSLIDEVLAGHHASVVEILRDQDPRGMLEAAAVALHERGIDGDTGPLWASLRAVMNLRHPSASEVLAAFLLEGRAA